MCASLLLQLDDTSSIYDALLVLPLSGVSGVSGVLGSVGSSFLFSLRVARDLKLAFW